jgi:hypothetical protein
MVEISFVGAGNRAKNVVVIAQKKLESAKSRIIGNMNRNRDNAVFTYRAEGKIKMAIGAIISRETDAV